LETGHLQLVIKKFCGLPTNAVRNKPGLPSAIELRMNGVKAVPFQSAALALPNPGSSSLPVISKVCVFESSDELAAAWACVSASTCNPNISVPGPKAPPTGLQALPLYWLKKAVLSLAATPAAKKVVYAGVAGVKAVIGPGSAEAEPALVNGVRLEVVAS